MYFIVHGIAIVPIISMHLDNKTPRTHITKPCFSTRLFNQLFYSSEDRHLCFRAAYLLSRPETVLQGQTLLEQAVPRNHLAQIMLSKWYAQQQHANADAILSAALYHPNVSPEAYYLYALRLFQQENYAASFPEQVYFYAYHAVGPHRLSFYRKNQEYTQDYYHLSALKLLAKLCHDGIGTEQNRKCAQQLYTLAALSGDPEALYALGQLYYIQGDYAKAYTYYKKVAHTDYTLEDGDATENAYIEYIKQAAAWSERQALLNNGMACFQHPTNAQSLDRAFACFSQLVKDPWVYSYDCVLQNTALQKIISLALTYKNISARCFLAQLFYTGLYAIDRSYNAAQQWAKLAVQLFIDNPSKELFDQLKDAQIPVILHRAMDQDNDTVAALAVGKMWYVALSNKWNMSSEKKAQVALNKAVKQCNEANIWLGKLFYYKKDYENAFYYYRNFLKDTSAEYDQALDGIATLAEDGYVKAIAWMIKYYAYQAKESKNYTKVLTVMQPLKQKLSSNLWRQLCNERVVQLLEELAQISNNSELNYIVGVCIYRNEKDLALRDEKAPFYLNKAVECGHVQAAYDLLDFYMFDSTDMSLSHIKTALEQATKSMQENFERLSNIFENFEQRAYTTHPEILLILAEIYMKEQVNLYARAYKCLVHAALQGVSTAEQALLKICLSTHIFSFFKSYPDYINNSEVLALFMRINPEQLLKVCSKQFIQQLEPKQQIALCCTLLKLISSSDVWHMYTTTAVYAFSENLAATTGDSELNYYLGKAIYLYSSYKTVHERLNHAQKYIDKAIQENGPYTFRALCLLMHSASQKIDAENFITVLDIESRLLEEAKKINTIHGDTAELLLFRNSIYSLERQAQEGNGYALYCLALALEKGIRGIIEPDTQKALDCILQASHQGNTYASIYLGMHYLAQEHNEEVFEKAFSYFVKACSQKQCKLETANERAYTLALEGLKQLSELQYLPACYKVVCILAQNSEIDMALDYFEHAEKLFQENVSNKDSVKDLVYSSGAYAIAEQLARNRHVRACYLLGCLHTYRSTSGKNIITASNVVELQKGFDYFKKAEKLGQELKKNDQSELAAGLAYYYFFQQQDMTQAHKYAHNALYYNKNHPQACCVLGLLYLKGCEELHGQDAVEKALALLTQAADNNDITAQSVLGNAYWHGEQVPLVCGGTIAQNRSKALEYLRKAAAQEDTEAIKFLQEIGDEICFNSLEEAQQHYKDNVQNGDGETLYKLGKIAYHYQRYEDALSYFTQAINKEHVLALCFLGTLYLTGKGVAYSAEIAHSCFAKACAVMKEIGVEITDTTIAIQGLRKLAQAGHSMSSYYLAAHFCKLGTAKALQEAKKFFKQAEFSSENVSSNPEITNLVMVSDCYPAFLEHADKEESDPELLYILGVSLLKRAQAGSMVIGNPFDQITSFQKAIQCFKKAAKQGYKEALPYVLSTEYNLAGIYKDNHQYNQAENIYKELVARNYKLAQRELADLYLKEKGTEHTGKEGILYGFQLLKQLANQGDSEAQSIVGMLYYNGHADVISPNFKQALAYIIQAAEQNEPDACRVLGCWYARGGNGLQKSTNKAFHFLKKAYSAHLPEVAFGLGVLLYDQNRYKEAYGYFQEAVDKDAKMALLYLIKMYAEGLGVHQSPDQALNYFQQLIKFVEHSNDQDGESMLVDEAKRLSIIETLISLDNSTVFKQRKWHLIARWFYNCAYKGKSKDTYEMARTRFDGLEQLKENMPALCLKARLAVEEGLCKVNAGVYSEEIVTLCREAVMCITKVIKNGGISKTGEYTCSELKEAIESVDSYLQRIIIALVYQIPYQQKIIELHQIFEKICKYSQI